MMYILCPYIKIELGAKNGQLLVEHRVSRQRTSIYRTIRVFSSDGAHVVNSANLIEMNID